MKSQNGDPGINSSIPGLGIILSVISALFFSACVVTVKMMPGVNPMFVLAARSAVQVSLCVSGMIWNGYPFQTVIGLKSKIFLSLLSISGGSTNFLVYASLEYLQPADVIGILYCSPALVSLLACIWLKEPCTVIHGFSVTLAVGGAIFVSKPSFLFGADDDSVALHWLGCVLALFGSFTYAGIFIFARLVPKIPAETTNCLIGIVSIVLSLPFCFTNKVQLPQCGWESFVFLTSAMLGVLGYILLTAAPRFEKATLVSVISSMEIVFTTPLQIIFLGELPPWNCYVGSVLIAISVLICGVLRCREQNLREGKKCRNDSKKFLKAPCLVNGKTLDKVEQELAKDTTV